MSVIIHKVSFQRIHKQNMQNDSNTFEGENIAPDKRGYPHNIFLISPKNICCGYSLEVSQQGTSNEYPQHMFSWRNKKNTFWLKKNTLSVPMMCVINGPLLQMQAKKVPTSLMKIH